MPDREEDWEVTSTAAEPMMRSFGGEREVEAGRGVGVGRGGLVRAGEREERERASATRLFSNRSQLSGADHGRERKFHRDLTSDEGEDPRETP